MKKTVYMHMPKGFGFWRVINTLNDISERFVGSKLLFDTPEESLEANRKAALTMPLVLATLTFETQDEEENNQ